MLSFQPLDLSQEDTVVALIRNADLCLQYGENLEPREEDYEDSERALAGGAPDIAMD